MCRYLVLDETDKMTEIGLVTSIFGPHTLVVQGLMHRYLVVDETDQMIETPMSPSTLSARVVVPCDITSFKDINFC
jgi:hypothetical protein